MQARLQYNAAQPKLAFNINYTLKHISYAGGFTMYVNTQHFNLCFVRLRFTLNNGFAWKVFLEIVWHRIIL